MASKTIHICDRCKSYVPKDSELFLLTISLGFPESSSGSQRVAINQNPKVSISNRIRGICQTCAEEITATYMLQHRDTSEILFKEQTPEDLQEKIKQYTDT